MAWWWQGNQAEKIANNRSINFDGKEYDYISTLEYDVDSQYFSLEIKHRSEQRKITSYVQRDYQKFPVYGDVKIREKVIKKINRKINPIKFLEEEITKIIPNKDLTSKILDYMTITTGYTPVWLLQAHKIEKLNQKITQERNEISNHQMLINALDKEIYNQINQIENNIYEYENVTLNLPTQKSSTNIFILFIILSFLLIGLILFATIYISESAAQNNINLIKYAEEEIEENQEHLKKLEENLPKAKLKYQIIISKIQEKIQIHLEEIDDVSIQSHHQSVDDHGFFDLRIDANRTFKNEFIGVYIIWNKTKNKYYVGQSKNVYKRLFKSHFSNGDVKNITFAKDWFNEDEFFYKTFSCDTKDELDTLEKEYIEMYDSFKNGYNKTGGNS